MKRLFYLCTLLLFYLFISAAEAATWYVNNTSGSASDSNACTAEAAPCATIQGGLSKVGYGTGAGANHVVEIITGTYTPSTRIGGTNGDQWPTGTSWSAPFQLRCRSGATCTVRGTDYFNLAIEPAGNKYIIIGGDGGVLSSGGVTAPGGGITFDGVNTGYTQVNVGESSSVAVIGNTFIRTENGNGMYGGIGNDFIIRSNTFHGGAHSAPSNDAKLGHALYFVGSNSLIERNLMYDLPYFGIHIYSTGHYPQPVNNIVRYNVVHDFSLQNCCGAGIVIGASDTNTNGTVFGNVIYNAPGSNGVGISVGFGSINAQVYNNTIYNVGQRGIDAVNSSGAIVRNNIISQIGGGGGEPGRVGSSSTFSNNLCNYAQTGIGCSVIESTPANIFVTPGTDFHLKAGSPAINAGANLGSTYSPDIAGIARPTTGPWDIGAYQYGTPPPPPSCPSIPNALVARYDFEGNGNDASGNGRTASLGSGWTYTTGKTGQGALSNGTSGITVADHDSLDPCAAFTYEGWINLPNNSGNYVFIVKNPSSKAYIFASINGYCGSGVPIGGYGETASHFACSTTALTPGFKHLAVTYDSTLTSNNIKLYLNGVLVSSANGTDLLTATTGTLQFCQSGFGELCPSGTVIDELRIYNYARSASEILSSVTAPVVFTIKLQVSSLKIGPSVNLKVGVP